MEIKSSGVKQLSHIKGPHNQGEKHGQIRSAKWDTVLRAGWSAARQTNSNTGTRRFWLGPLSGDYEARRRVRRMVGVGMELLRPDGEVEGFVAKKDAVLILVVRGRACYAQAHIPNDEDAMVFQVYFSAGCCDMRNLPASIART